ATNIKELNDLKPTEIMLDPILKIKQSNALKNREIPKRIREIVDLIYNKVLNKTENITTLDQFIIGVSGGGELTENIYVLGENKDLLKNKKIPLNDIIKTFLNNSLSMLNNYYNNDSMKNQITRLEIYKKQNMFNIIIEEIKKYISDFEKHLNFVNFKLNKNKTFDQTNFFYTKTLKDHITKIKTLYHKANENYYQDIINRMNIFTNKEDFKDNGKFDKEIRILDNKYLKGKKTTDLQNIRKKKNERKAETFDQQLDDLWGLVNDRDRQNNYIDDAYNICKQKFEMYKIKDTIPEKLLEVLEILQTHTEKKAFHSFDLISEVYLKEQEKTRLKRVKEKEEKIILEKFYQQDICRGVGYNRVTCRRQGSGNNSGKIRNNSVRVKIENNKNEVPWNSYKIIRNIPENQNTINNIERLREDIRARRQQIRDTIRNLFRAQNDELNHLNQNIRNLNDNQNTIMNHQSKTITRIETLRQRHMDGYEELATDMRNIRNNLINIDTNQETINNMNIARIREIHNILNQHHNNIINKIRTGNQQNTNLITQDDMNRIERIEDFIRRLNDIRNEFRETIREIENSNQQQQQ
ncbi:26094_t:CDS:2, partial [Gigaspora margarita]